METLIKTGVITAMKEEAEIIIQKYSLQKIKTLAHITVFESTDEKNIVLILCGVGKVQSAIATTYVFENYEIDKLINIGIAGNLGNMDMQVGDVMLPNTFFQYDMYLPFEGEHLDYAKKPIFITNTIGENYDLEKFGVILNGVCVTGDSFVNNNDQVQRLRNEFEADVCEMEAFSILSVAREYNALEKCIVIKGVSDGADSEAKDAHMSNLEFAMENSVAILDFIIS